MRHIALAILVLAMVPAVGKGQASNDQWNSVRSIASGRTVKVTVGKDTVIAGTFLNASGDSLIVRRDATAMTLDRPAIRGIKVLSSSKRRLNMIVYGSIGMVAGLIPGAIIDAEINNETGNGGAAKPMLGALGAGIALFATRHSGYSTAYSAHSAGHTNIAPLGSVGSFDQLDRRIGPGDKVYVTGADGGRVDGKVDRLSATSLAIIAGGKRYEFRPGEVNAISQRLPDSLVNGTLWGLLVGAGAGAGLTAVDPAEHSGVAEYLVSAGIGGGIGAGVGAVLDRLHKGQKVVYVRPSEPKTASVLRTLNIAPVISRNAKGAKLSLSF